MRRIPALLLLLSLGLFVQAQTPVWEVISPSTVDRAHPLLGHGDVLELRFSIVDAMNNSIAFYATSNLIWKQVETDRGYVAHPSIEWIDNAAYIKVKIADFETLCEMMTKLPLRPGTRCQLSFGNFSCLARARDGSAIDQLPEATFHFEIR